MPGKRFPKVYDINAKFTLPMILAARSGLRRSLIEYARLFGLWSPNGIEIVATT
jgi:hypothetical protein